MTGVTVLHGDCLEVLASLPSASVDAIVTDPPAGIAFMGRTWDTNKGGRDAWVAWLTSVMVEAHRVLKPGGHALVWALPRTSHWTATAVEDAGFEIRDCVVHLFGTGFPKSLDVSKAIDRVRDDREDILCVTRWLATARDTAGWSNRQIDEVFGTNGMAGHWTSVQSQPSVPTWDQWVKLRELIGFGPEMDAEVWRLNGRKGHPGEAWAEREVMGYGVSGATAIMQGIGVETITGGVYDITAPATDEARRWEGWGTALKPGQEHWWLVRKPLSGTVAANVVGYGTGGINVDGCRVVGEATAGRWPTNLVLTHSAVCDEGGPCAEDCPVGELDRQSVGASRFFPAFRYQAKAPARERPKVDGVTHPTAKSLQLMRWLVRMITPPGGTVLDPFAGSGTTLEAARLEGFDVIGVEAEADYLPLIAARLARVPTPRTET